MEQLLPVSFIAPLLLLVLTLEALLLLFVWWKKEKGLPFAQTFSFLGAGAAFSVALGISLSQGNILWVYVALIAAFVFHILDLCLRWHS